MFGNISEFVEFCQRRNVTLYNHQYRMICDLYSGNRLAFNVSRQMGTSRMLALYASFLAEFKGKSVALVGTRLEATADANRIVRDGAFGMTHATRECVAFENGGRVFFTSANSRSFIGVSLDVFIIDGFNQRNNNAEFLAAIYPCVSGTRDSQVVIADVPSTAIFRDLSNNGTFKTFRYPWSVIQGRDQAWRDRTLEMVGQTAFIQQYEASFVSETPEQPPRFIGGHNGR